MKKLFLFFLFLFCSTVGATVFTDLKFGSSQIADSQWNVSACTQTASCQIYSTSPGTMYKIPWTSGQWSWSSGQYVQFSETGNATNPYEGKVYNSNGSLAGTIGTGHIVNMGTDSNGKSLFFFVGNDNDTGQLFSTNYGLTGTGGYSWTGTLNPTTTQVNSFASTGSTSPLSAGQTAAPTVTGTSVTYSTRNSVSGNTTQVYRTPTTTTTYSNGTTTTSTGSESLYQTRVNSTIVTNKIVNGVLTTISTPITKVTAAATGATTVEANGSATSTTQSVNQGLNAEVFRYDPKNYNCVFGICAWNFTYHTPSTSRNSYGNPVNTYRTTNGMFFATNSNLPNNDNSLFGRNEGTVIRFTGTITAPSSQSHPDGSVYRLYFYNNTDDGFKMNINGGTIINQNSTITYQTLFSYTSSGYIDVVAGQTYNIEAWYWNTTGGLGHTLYWDYGDGMRTIPNAAFTDGTIGNIDIDLTGVSYSDGNIVDITGSSIAPTVVSTSIDNVESSSSSSTNTDSVSVTRSTSTGNYTDTYVGTTTVTTTTTTPVTTTTYSDGSTTTSNGTSSSTTDTTYTITTTLGVAPIYSRSAPNTGGNSVYVKQASAWSNTQVSITQDGNNNAVTGIDNGWAKVDGNNSVITTKQYGTGNILGIDMNAWGNNITINQGNTTTDVSNNILMFDSHGNGNNVSLNQLSNTNTASVKLTYDINTVNLTQQTGTLNKSYVTIIGNYNTVNNTQTGGSNLAIVNISGDNNTATINQTGNSHSALLNLINAGGANTVSVTQTGNGDTYSLQQTCTNPAGCSVSVVRNK